MTGITFITQQGWFWFKSLCFKNIFKSLWEKHIWRKPVWKQRDTHIFRWGGDRHLSAVMAHTIVTTTVGDPWVGKSSLYLCKTMGAFPDHHVSAEEAEDCEPVMFTVDNNTQCQLDIFEVSGDLYDFNEIRYFNYMRSDIVLLVFSVVRPSSFENISLRWEPELRRYRRKSSPILLVGTQADLRDDPDVIQNLTMHGKSCVTTEEAQRLARRIKAVKYIECSAKNMTGIHEVFDEIVHLARSVHKKHGKDGCIISWCLSQCILLILYQYREVGFATESNSVMGILIKTVLCISACYNRSLTYNWARFKWDTLQTFGSTHGYVNNTFGSYM